MADDMVKQAQRFINRTYGTYPGIPRVEEDGKTGWSTMYALTRCLQYELGISALSDSFGPTTLSTLTSRWPSINASTAPSANVVRIIQSGLYCKGYDGGEIDGIYNSRVSAAVQKLKSEAGVAGAYPGDAMVPKLFKALLNMDPYVTISGGSDTVRSIQQWMNSKYVNRLNYFIVPCDGFFSRDVQKALMFAIQYQIGMTDDVANGVFGPGTQSGLKANTLSAGSSGTWVQLFSAAMIFNQRSGVAFTSSFDSNLSSRVSTFQSFVKLPVTGQGDFQTWASLLVSTGDPTRPGAALDCVTEITPARAQSLKAAGFQVAGRYLCNVAGTDLDKIIKPGELAVIADNGMRVFPIYQTYGGSASYFNGPQGASDALDAMYWANYHGFKPGSRIYFAVDFDALDYQVTDSILPHFRGIKSTMDSYTSGYQMGVYGPRNICSRVAAEGLTSASFVSDMSTGFSGNLGYPMPEDWAFDQIATITVGSGSGSIQIDKNVYSGRDAGQSSFNPPAPSDQLDVGFDKTQNGALLAEIQHYLESKGIPEEGGNIGEDAIQVNTTTEAFNVVMGYDAVFTGLARALRMRKALIMIPVLWEFRKWSTLDALADTGVETYYTSGDWDPFDIWIKNDSSTGIAQIFAKTAIIARNYAIRQGIINGTIMDETKDADLWNIWQKLHDDDAFSMGTTAHVLIQGADDVGIPRPNLTYSQENSRLVLKRFRGFGEEAETDSQIQIGLYQILEKYFAPLRG
ncbi:glycoside hydrolase domain-containing protein [Streptomyces sp. NPDC006923]|uniref:glycoside hydrolase domain-containing protein n=1 Tax=Streptomyces sp. NPDC006923 TaxID=3155355 RepID=UPI0033C25EFC